MRALREKRARAPPCSRCHTAPGPRAPWSRTRHKGLRGHRRGRGRSAPHVEDQAVISTGRRCSSSQRGTGGGGWELGKSRPVACGAYPHTKPRRLNPGRHARPDRTTANFSRGGDKAAAPSSTSRLRLHRRRRHRRAKASLCSERPRRTSQAPVERPAA